MAGLLLAGAGRLRAARRSDAGTLVWVVTSLAPLTVSELHAIAAPPGVGVPGVGGARITP